MTSLLCFLLLFIFASVQTLAAPPIDKTTDKPKVTEKRKRSPVRRGLIPPPPPAAPFGGQFLFMGGPAFMTLNDVKKRRVELCRQLAEAKTTVEFMDKKVTERKDRSKLFEGLYKEGVVSKRELEGAQDSVNQATRELEQDKQKLNTLQQELNQIDTVLASSSKDAVQK